MMCSILFALLLTVQGSPSDTLWTDSTEYYSISVHFPPVALENQVVGDRLEAYATGQIQDFKDIFEEWFMDDPLLSGWYLSVNFSEEPSPEGMLGIIAWSWNYTGGAHGNSWTQGFVFDLETDSLLGPLELLGGQEQFDSFAQKVMEQLFELNEDEGWIVEGASAIPENYHTLLPVPDEEGDLAGFTAFFPPYQVACYASGTHEVYVPLEDF